jgi:hypothetical protein
MLGEKAAMQRWLRKLPMQSAFWPKSSGLRVDGGSSKSGEQQTTRQKSDE